MQRVDICEFCADELSAAYDVKRIGETRAKVCAQCGRKMLLGRYELTKKARTA